MGYNSRGALFAREIRPVDPYEFADPRATLWFLGRHTPIEFIIGDDELVRHAETLRRLRDGGACVQASFVETLAKRR